MKRKISLSIISALCLSSFLASCSNEEPVPVPNSEPVSQRIRSIEQACEEAIAFLKESGYNVSNSRSALLPKVEVIYGHSSRNASDTLIYAVNLEDGYVLVSAPLAAEPVLAYIDKGCYDESNINPNSGFSLFMEKALDYTGEASSIPTDPVMPPRPITRTVVSNATPKITVEWGQQYPEGLYCPNGVCGCVQTAMAQILSYFETPTLWEMHYMYPPQTFEINWKDIKKHKKSFDNLQAYEQHMASCTASVEAHQILAHLCREFGDMNGAIYEFDINGNYTGSKSYIAMWNYRTLLPKRTVEDIRDFRGYEKNDCIRLFDLLYNKKAVAHFHGNAGTGELQKYHAWVCDGGREYKTYSGFITIDGEEGIEYRHYFHFNWGFNGVDNGYFLADVYNTSCGVSEGNLPQITVSSISRGDDFRNNVQYYAIY